MGKGIAQRRRLRRALNAAEGNLHRIHNGKALPRRTAEPPREVNDLPKSLRKMLALKASWSAVGARNAGLREVELTVALEATALLRPCAGGDGAEPKAQDSWGRCAAG
jgi:hypothetical protein